MARMKILAGDFLQGEGTYYNGVVTIETALYPWPGLQLPATTIRSVEVTGAEPTRAVGTSLVQAAAAGLVMGPLGAVAGFMLGDEHEEVTFMVTLRDGRKFLACSHDNTHEQLAQHIARRSSSEIGGW